MDAGVLPFVLLAVSVVLFAGEFFVPSGGLITALAVISLVASIVFAAQEWWTESQGYFWSFVGAAFVLVPLSIGAAITALPHTGWGRRMMLEPPSPDEITGYQDEMDFLSSQVGRVGLTVTVLNPGGIVEINGERIHCEGDGMMVDRGETVEVTAVSGNRLRVRPSDRPVDPPESKGEDPPLDFAEFES